MEPNSFPIQSSSDHRGKVTFVNDFDMTDVKRTYTVSNKLVKTVRAWHRHQNEQKWITVQKGEFLVCVVKVDSFKNPNEEAEVIEFLLNTENNVLFVPGGYANGAMNLTDENEIRYFSSSTLEESSNDDFRIDAKFWNPWEIYNPNVYE
jgi:dTDP-4-dehydrorhamnose 3,5-epimerase-like enzyme